jgi:hypothetical protein
MITTDSLKYLPQMGLDPSRVVGCAVAKCQNSNASRGINGALSDQGCEGALLPTPGENQHVDQDHNGSYCRRHGTAIPRACHGQWQSRQRIHYKSAQYCTLQYDDPSDVTRVYC